MDPANRRLHCAIGMLPDELLLATLDCILLFRGPLWSSFEEDLRRRENGRRIQTFYSLTLTCRKWNALATPYLYRSFIQPASETALSKTALFARTLLEKPERRNHLQYMESQVYHPLHASAQASYSKSLIDALQDAAAECSYSPPADQIACRLHRTLAYLRALCANLQETAMYRPDSTIFDHRHPSLRRIFTKGHWFGSVYPELAPIQSITLIACSSDRALMLEAIWLDYCNVTLDRICTYLETMSVPGVLKSFACRWKTPDQDTSYSVPIELDKLAKALSLYQHSLESLVLDTLESTWQVSLDENIPTLGSMRHFTALRHLDVSGLVLWNDNDTNEHPPLASILPASLETLIIHVEWDDDVEESLEALARVCLKEFPNLKMVDCSWRPAPCDMADVLVGMFEDAGVKLRLSTTEEV